MPIEKENRPANQSSRLLAGGDVSVSDFNQSETTVTFINSTILKSENFSLQQQQHQIQFNTRGPDEHHNLMLIM